MAIYRESRTALSAASIRAYHYSHDTQKIFDDPVAHLLLTAEEEEFFLSSRVERLKLLDYALAMSCPDRAAMIREFMRLSADAAEMLSRARYTEDQLTEAVSHGVRQYVLIGAGMDSFAFRRPDLNQRLQIFEIDRPAAQDFKRQRLAEVGLEPPANLYFVPVDFTQGNVDTALAQSVFEPQVPSFFSWLGSTQYLDQDTVLVTVQAIRQIAAPGSYLVFDYFDVNAFDSAKAAPRMQELVTRLRSIEPLCCGFKPQALESDLTNLGFHIHDHLNPSEIGVRYFRGRTDGYYPTEHSHFMCAVVK